MFKKVTGELSWEIKVSLLEGKLPNFCQKQFIHTWYVLIIFVMYFVCD